MRTITNTNIWICPYRLHTKKCILWYLHTDAVVKHHSKWKGRWFSSYSLLSISIINTENWSFRQWRRDIILPMITAQLRVLVVRKACNSLHWWFAPRKHNWSNGILPHRDEKMTCRKHYIIGKYVRILLFYFMISKMIRVKYLFTSTMVDLLALALPYDCSSTNCAVLKDI